MLIELSEEDRKELVKLYEEAEKTPYLVYQTEMRGGIPHARDTASDAWNRVRYKMEELGKKYGFDPRKMKGINKKTGEIHIGKKE